MLPLAPWLWAVCIGLMASWAWTFTRYALLRHPGSFVALELKGETFCSLRMRNGLFVHGDIAAQSYVLPWLIVLHVVCEGSGARHYVALFPDSMAQEVHRRLRVRLRWAKYAERHLDANDASL